jgi:hypothetical protein
MTCSRIIAALPRGTCSLAPGDLAKSEMQKSPVLAGPFQDCQRLALKGDRPRELAIRKPTSQAMGEGALRSFYRRTAALGDAKADTIDWRWIVLAKWYRLAALGSP